MTATLTLSPAELSAWCRCQAEALERLELAEPLRQAAALLHTAARACFEQSKSPQGQAWPPLKDRSGRPPLRKTGALMAAASGGLGSTTVIGPSSLTLTVSLPYAGAHQQGATIHRPARSRSKPWVFLVDGKKAFARRIKAYSFTIPARPYLGIGPQDGAALERLFADFAVKRLEALT